jgi:microcystin degradation protein MlrC
MRVAIAGFSLESVSFLPQPTTLADFQRRETRGQAVLDSHRDTNSVIGGFVKICEAEGIEMIGIVSTGAGAAAAATDEAFDHYTRAICEGIAKVRDRIDAVLLHLHGAMTTVTRTDPDADVVRELRKVVGKDTPIVLGLDYHGNLDGEILKHCTALFGYHYSPHTDMGETGERAARCLVRLLRGEIRPVMAVARPGVMVPSIFSATNLHPLADIVAESIELPKRFEKLIDVSVFAGFSYADVPNCGFSVVVVADGDETLARTVASGLSDSIRGLRHQLYKRDLVHGLKAGVALALRRSNSASRPIVLLEHADRLNDSTHILHELQRQNASKAFVPYLWDPKAAQQAIRAGVGATVTLRAGGHSSDRAGGPVTLKGKVVFAGEKEFVSTGPVGRGRKVRLGPTAVIESGGIVVSITSNPETALDEDCFTEFGYRSADFPIVLLRSKTHFRAVWEKVAEEILIVDTPDYGPADLTTLPYKHVPKDKVFPFTDAP